MQKSLSNHIFNCPNSENLGDLVLFCIVPVETIPYSPLSSFKRTSALASKANAYQVYGVVAGDF